jgi:hypothetical protein
VAAQTFKEKSGVMNCSEISLYLQRFNTKQENSSCMPRTDFQRRIVNSRVCIALTKRPRLAVTLLLLVALIAVQGGAVAGDGSLGDGGLIEPLGGNETDNPGP